MLAAEAEQSASQLQSVEALIKTQDEETARLSGELTKLRGAADAAQAASAARLAQATALRADLDAARTEAERQRVELATAVEAEKAAVVQAKAKAASLQQQAEALRVVVAEREVAAGKLAADLDRAQAQSNDRKNEIDKLAAVLKSRQAVLRNRERDVERLSRDIDFGAALSARQPGRSAASGRRARWCADGNRACFSRTAAHIRSAAGGTRRAVPRAATELPAVRGEIAILEAALADLRQEAGRKVEGIYQFVQRLAVRRQPGRAGRGGAARCGTREGRGVNHTRRLYARQPRRRCRAERAHPRA